MSYLLDTDICIYLIKRKPLSLGKRFRALTPGEVAVSSVTVAELQYGVFKSQYVARNQQALDEFLLPLTVEAFDHRAAAHYGRVRAHLEGAWTSIGALDMLIAAHALALGSILVTNNVREFSRVPLLQVENWAEEDNG